jgi:hypothetical protein
MLPEPSLGSLPAPASSKHVRAHMATVTGHRVSLPRAACLCSSPSVLGPPYPLSVLALVSSRSCLMIQNATNSPERSRLSYVLGDSIRIPSPIVIDATTLDFGSQSGFQDKISAAQIGFLSFKIFALHRMF